MARVEGFDVPSGIVKPGSFGVLGDSHSNVGVIGLSLNNSAVRGQNDSDGAPAVRGDNNRAGGGVFGGSVDGNGVYGHSVNKAGVFGYSVYGNAGEFEGRVRVAGWLTKPAGSFLIDHPVDPANKYLAHSFVESPEMKNVYDGTAVLDERGEATVQLPPWFEALNQEFRYQLTAIGAYAPVYIAREIEGGSFAIAGGKQGSKVSWQVTGNRKDPWAKANPLVVEQEKPENERGRFLYPEVQGEPPEKGIRQTSFPELSPQGSPSPSAAQ